jgi:hypothetical protein
VLGAVAAAVIAYALWARAQPPLQPWHRGHLGEEFTAAKADDVATLDDYLALEGRVFDEMDAKVYWTSLVPEFDPFNYNAFTANASLQVHRMTRATTRRIRRMAAQGPIADFPSTPFGGHCPRRALVRGLAGRHRSVVPPSDRGKA